jgi:hypothetical protein
MLAVYDLSLPVKVISILSAMILTAIHLEGQVLEFPQTVPQTVENDTDERRWVPGAVVEVPPIFTTGPFELKRPAAADPFTKYLERRMKRSYYFLRWPPPPRVELSRPPDEFRAADYLTPEYRKAVEQFDDLRFQFAIDPAFDPDAYY